MSKKGDFLMLLERLFSLLDPLVYLAGFLLPVTCHQLVGIFFDSLSLLVLPLLDKLLLFGP
jgi:hypothetical protein